MKNYPNKNSAFTLIELSVVLIIVVALVIGIIAASSVVSSARLSQARNMTGSAPVLQVENLVMWLESTSKKSFEDSETRGDLPVSVWYDINPQSIIKNNFVASGSNRPIYTKNAVSGLPGLKFDGVDDFMTNTVPGLMGRMSAQATWIFVFKVDAMNKDQTFMSIEQGGNRFIIQLDSNNLFTQIEGNNNISTNVVADFLNVPYVVTAIRKVGDNPPVAIYLNGEFSYNSGNSNNEGSSEYDQGMNTFTNSVVIGNRDSAEESVSGYLLEMIVYNRAITPQERFNIEEYLKKKWKLRMN